VLIALLLADLFWITVSLTCSPAGIGPGVETSRRGGVACGSATRT